MSLHRAQKSSCVARSGLPALQEPVHHPRREPRPSCPQPQMCCRSRCCSVPRNPHMHAVCADRSQWSTALLTEPPGGQLSCHALVVPSPLGATRSHERSVLSLLPARGCSRRRMQLSPPPPNIRYYYKNVDAVMSEDLRLQVVPQAHGRRDSLEKLHS
jgi:hypothetical protein